MLKKIVTVLAVVLLSICTLTFTADFQQIKMREICDAFAIESLTETESNVIALVNGSEAYSYNMHLENIAFSHDAFRAAGSAGADETADWIANQFKSFGLEVEKEEFQFTSWDLRSKPALVIDDDGNIATTSDQITIESFQCEHYSLQGNVFADLVVLPLPRASDYGELGDTPIGTLWDAVNTTGKVVLIGREVRLDYRWQQIFNSKLRGQPPAAVIYTWWYDWMAFVPDFFSSAGGRPVTPFGHYYWDLGIAAGFVDYDDGLLIRSRESGMDVSAKVVIDSIVGLGPHYNVVGKLISDREPAKLVIVCGHYDSVMCAGFCDNGAGASGVVELAHVFAEAVKRGLYYPKYSLLFLALASEEIGLVGSINYVAQHKAEMENIVAVINLDCIGTDTFEVTETQPDHGIDLDETVLNAAVDLGINAQVIEPDQADETVFLHPTAGDDILMYWWDMSLGIGDAHPIGSSVLLSSSPLLYSDMWSVGKPGWIHTSNDKSPTADWVEQQDLEDHVKVAALTVMRVSPRVLSTDLNSDGIVNLQDVYILARAYSSHGPDIPNVGDLPSQNWNAIADLNEDGWVNLHDIYKVARDYGKAT